MHIVAIRGTGVTRRAAAVQRALRGHHEFVVDLLAEFRVHGFRADGPAVECRVSPAV